MVINTSGTDPDARDLKQSFPLRRKGIIEYVALMCDLIHLAVYNRNGRTAVLLPSKRPDIKINKPGKVGFDRRVIPGNLYLHPE